MFKSGFELDTDAKLLAAQHNQSDVSVWQRGKIVYYGGPIERISSEAVWINSGMYFKATYQFKIK
ncbi:hypothetical protein [Cohnella nanjingensis]|uniref:Uncharacterized protein n=1 Tax=Cohnella nanjingensis TaxID=1387779 RepID=A0A7X0RMI6_9BACL|nr:hypothetical protein [Cohnella nanjingensis]MBB6670263.1 hypothetical protein [Cohnella nanjingensis]